ncbi:MAG: type III-A CRISPR-associated protein Cas10/Csm1 [Thermoplasmata archaeon]
MPRDIPDDEFVLSVSSLLHDIGKVRQRYERGNTHQFYSHQIVRELHELAGLRDGRIYSLISNLVLHHHTREDDLPEDLKRDGNFKKLLSILQFSDRTSADHDREDRDPEQAEDFKNRFTVAMEKIFSHLDSWRGEQHYFPMYMLHDSSDTINFFKDRESWDRGSTNFDFLKRIDSYSVKALTSMRFRPNFKREYVNKMTSILMDSVRTVPSAFWYSKAEIPLFDHLKMTSAIASCKLYNESDFLLISADTSGIQEYIFRRVRAEKADDRASRRTRGRSFIVRLLSDAIQSLLEIRLGLYDYNTVYEGSGGFLVMCPLKPDTEERMNELLREIDQFCYMDFRRLSSVISFRNVSFDDLSSPEDNTKSSNLIERIQELRDETGRKKTSRAKILIHDDPDHFFNPMKPGEGTCTSCGLDTAVREGKCLWCLREENLGSRLVRNLGKLMIHKKIYDSAAAFEDENSIVFNFGSTTIVYTMDEDRDDDHAEYSEDISINDSDFMRWTQKDTSSWKFIFLGNNVPIIEDKGSRSLMPFDIMAGCKESGGEGRDCMPLAVAKMDVDDMGKIMAYGFSKPTLSKISTISYLISFFFSAFLNSVAESNRVYVIFSGGDDITAVGEVRNILNFSLELRSMFRNFAGPYIGLSCGIVTMHHSYPIRRAVEMAEKNLMSSKNFQTDRRRKDSLTIFDSTLPWESFQSSMKTATEIYTEIMKNGNLGKSFPYLLINLDAKNPYRDGRPEEVMIPDYYLYYYLSRNFGGDNMEKLYEMIRKKDEFRHIGVTSRVALLKIRGDK